MSGCCRRRTPAAKSRVLPGRRRLGGWGKLGAGVPEPPPGPGGGRLPSRASLTFPGPRTKLWRKRGRNREGKGVPGSEKIPRRHPHSRRTAPRFTTARYTQLIITEATNSTHTL